MMNDDCCCARYQRRWNEHAKYCPVYYKGRIEELEQQLLEVRKIYGDGGHATFEPNAIGVLVAKRLKDFIDWWDSFTFGRPQHPRPVAYAAWCHQADRIELLEQENQHLKEQLDMVDKVLGGT